MRPETADSRKQAQRDMFEIEHERHCDLQLVYDVPNDELAVILQPARRAHVARTVLAQLTMDFDEDGLMIGMQMTSSINASPALDLDVAQALRPFKACDNVTLDDQLGYIYVRAWEPYEDEVAYVVEGDAYFDLAGDGGLLAVRIPRTTRDYELDPFSAFSGLQWKAEVAGGGSLSQFGLM